jgi:hypothetical protein
MLLIFTINKKKFADELYELQWLIIRVQIEPLHMTYINIY